MAKIDKQALKKDLLFRLRKEKDQILSAARSAHEGAVHSEAVAKSKYETFGLELSYLAGSQYERANILSHDIAKLEQQRLPAFTEDDPVGVWACVEVASESGEEFYFISLFGAGMTILQGQHSVVILSPESPLGKKLVGCWEGDDFQIPGQPVKTIRAIC